MINKETMYNNMLISWKNFCGKFPIFKNIRRMSS